MSTVAHMYVRERYLPIVKVVNAECGGFNDVLWSREIRRSIYMLSTLSSHTGCFGSNRTSLVR